MLGSQRAMSTKRPGITQELSCSRYRGSVCEGQQRVVDGEMICFGMNKSQGWLGIQLFTFRRRNESPPPLAHSWLGRLIVGSSPKFLAPIPWFSAKVIGAASWNPDWKMAPHAALLCSKDSDSPPIRISYCSLHLYNILRSW